MCNICVDFLYPKDEILTSIKVCLINYIIKINIINVSDFKCLLYFEILVPGEKVEFEAFMQANATLIEGGKWSCFLCGKITSHIGNMRQHFETYHYKTSDTYCCKLCGKECPTKNALACHKVKCRRKMCMAPSNNKPLF